MILDRALVLDVMVIPVSSGSLQMIDHTPYNRLMYTWIPHTTEGIVG